MKFKIKKTDNNSKARIGELITDHGKIKTPIFMPVGTSGTVKGIHQHELVKDTQAEIILNNTYHLYLRPKLEVIEKSKGIHKFIGWNKPILTDSGGYQVYSLSNTRKITEKGVMAKIPGKIGGKMNTVGGSQIQMVVVVLGRIMMTEMDGILTTKMTTLKEMAWRECVARPDLVDWMGDKVKMLWFGIEWVSEWR